MNLRFGITVSSIELDRKKSTYHIELSELGKKMNLFFKEKSYSDGVETYSIGIICDHPRFAEFSIPQKPKYYADVHQIIKNSVCPETHTYKTLFIEYVMDFEPFASSNREEGLHIVAQALMNYLDNLKYPKAIKDFDKEAFNRDMRTFLKNEGWIEEQQKWIPVVNENSSEQESTERKPIEHPVIPPPVIQPQVRIKDTDPVDKQIDKYINRDKFAHQTSDDQKTYSLLSDESLRKPLNEGLNKIAIAFKEIACNKPEIKKYQKAIKEGLASFDDIYMDLDSEDMDQVCMSIEDLMDIVELESSGGLLNKWRYGFNPK